MFKEVVVASSVLLAGLLTGCQSESSPSSCTPNEVRYALDGNLLVYPLEGQAVVEGEYGARFTPVMTTDGDLDGDGEAEAVAVIRMEGAGSGTFYALAASQLQDCAYQPLDAVWLGDRIEVSGLRVLPDDHVDAGMILVDLAVRGADQSMAEAPKLRVSRMYLVQDGKLVLQDPY